MPPTDDNKQAKLLDDLASFYTSSSHFHFTPPQSPVKVTPPTSDSEQDPHSAVPEVQYDTVFNNLKSHDVVTRRRKSNSHSNRRQSSLAAAVKTTQERPRRRPVSKMDSSSHSSDRRAPRRSKSSDGMLEGSSHHTKSVEVDMELPLKTGEDDRNGSALEKLKRRSSSHSAERRRAAPGRSKSDGLMDMDISGRGSSRGASRGVRRHLVRQEAPDEEACEGDTTQRGGTTHADEGEGVREKEADAMNFAHISDEQVHRPKGGEYDENKRRSSSREHRRRARGSSRSADVLETDIGAMDGSSRGTSRDARRRHRNRSGQENRDDDLKVAPEQTKSSENRDGGIPEVESPSHRKGPSSRDMSEDVILKSERNQTSSRSINGRISSHNRQRSGVVREVDVVVDIGPAPLSSISTKMEELKVDPSSHVYEGQSTGHHDHQHTQRSNPPSSANDGNATLSNTRRRPSRSRGNSKWSAMKERSASRGKSNEQRNRLELTGDNSAVVNTFPQQNSEALSHPLEIAALKPRSDRLLINDNEKKSDGAKPKSTIFKNLLGKSMHKKRSSIHAAKDDNAISLEPSNFAIHQEEEEVIGRTSERALASSNSGSSVSGGEGDDQITASMEEEGKESKKNATTIFKGLVSRSKGKKKSSQDSSQDDTAKSSVSFSAEGQEKVTSEENPEIKKNARWKGLKSGMDFTSKLMKAASEKQKKMTGTEVNQPDTDVNRTVRNELTEDAHAQSKKSAIRNRAVSGVKMDNDAAQEPAQEPAKDLPLDCGLTSGGNSFSVDVMKGLDESLPHAMIEGEDEHDHSFEENVALLHEVLKPSNGPNLFSVLEGTTKAPAATPLSKGAPALDRRSILPALSAPSMRFNVDQTSELVVANRIQPTIVENEEEDEDEGGSEDESEMENKDGNGDNRNEPEKENKGNDAVEDPKESAIPDEVHRHEHGPDNEDSESDSDYEPNDFLSSMQFMQLQLSMSSSLDLDITIRSLEPEARNEDGVLVHRMAAEKVNFKFESTSILVENSHDPSSCMPERDPKDQKKPRSSFLKAKVNATQPSELEIEFERLRREILACALRTQSAREVIRRFQEEITEKRKCYDEAERHRQESIRALKARKISVHIVQGS